jgi:hypothetical protein
LTKINPNFEAGRFDHCPATELEIWLQTGSKTAFPVCGRPTGGSFVGNKNFSENKPTTNGQSLALGFGKKRRPTGSSQATEKFTSSTASGARA